MQEEVTQKTIALVIKTAKLDANVLKAATISEEIAQSQDDNYPVTGLPNSYRVDILEEQKRKIQEYLTDLIEYEQEEYIFQMSQQKLEREFNKVIERVFLRKMSIDNLRYCLKHIYQDSVSGKMYCLHGYSDEEVLSMDESKVEARGKVEVPIWEKLNLTLSEAAVYSGIGMNNLRKICVENEK